MTQIFAHRGCSSSYPENTLPAFEKAVAIADGIELDVHLTKDRQLVVIHDETIDRTTDGSGVVGEMTVAQLQKFNAGAHFKKKQITTKIPTLQEVLDLLLAKNFQGILNIEIKTDVTHYEGIEEELVLLLARYHPSFSLIFSSFLLASLEKLALLLPGSNLAYIFREEMKKVEIAEKMAFLSAMHPKITWLREHHDLLQAERKGWRKWRDCFISSQQSISIKKEQRFWTVNQEVDMRLCFEKKVTGFFTDYPEKAMKIREEYNG